jgi:hypothetical protein
MQWTDQGHCWIPHPANERSARLLSGKTKTPSSHLGLQLRVTLLQAAMARAHTQRQRNKPQRTMQGQITLHSKEKMGQVDRRKTKSTGFASKDQQATKETIVDRQQGAELEKEILITQETSFTIKSNLAYGHSIGLTPKSDTLRIYHQNIRGAKTYQNWNRWKEGIQQLNTWGVGIATLVETNTQWTQTNKNIAQAMAQSINNQTKLSYSGSNEASDTDFQPGGTASVALGKWTGRITKRIVDSSGLERWSGFHLQGKGQKSLIVLSAYRPTQSSDPSD